MKTKNRNILTTFALYRIILVLYTYFSQLTVSYYSLLCFNYYIRLYSLLSKNSRKVKKITKKTKMKNSNIVNYFRSSLYNTSSRDLYSLIFAYIRLYSLCPKNCREVKK